MILGFSAAVIAIACGVAVAFGAFAYSVIPVKSDIARRLERAENMSWEGLSSRSEAFAKLFNERQRGSMRRKLDEAGWYETTPEKIAAQVVAFALFGLIASLTFAVIMGGDDDSYFAVVPVTVLAGYMPISRLSRAAKKRKNDIQRALPDFLDMLASTVSAGLAFNAALGYAQDVAAGPLGEEIKASLSEVRLGRSRADALRSMSARVRQDQLNTFVTAVIQAERLGSNLGAVLRELADEVRNARMTRAEELANMMPTKMALPMALFMLPALFLMIFGGVIAEFLAHQ
ncbi:MAG: type II secretion system F family protein [Candidatus Eremiobacteraeota bacterium]|nr:type II secretion system F family protein [Candidatus Eremiobacteraeota bacterium]